MKTLAALGEFALLERRFSDAEKRYRKLLNKNSQDVVALNQLVWVLSTDLSRTDESLALIMKEGAIIENRLGS